MQFPSKRELDRRLVGGSLLFGIGWGIARICRGPAVAILLKGHWQAIVFLHLRRNYRRSILLNNG
jgi:hypothetical protein